ncbi:MAG TPA: putative sugar nucleotidyl transferase, partial [Longimicrobiaceae bacterium]|nr:putative sugar nucleotidyl transferase [Longimicrobiaceae bacterium]
EWAPFSLTRPAGELLFGTLTLRARAERVLGLTCTLALAPDHLTRFEEQGAPPVADVSGALPTGGDRLFWLSRAVPGWNAALPESATTDRGGPVTVGGAVAGWFAPAGSEPPAGFLDHPQRAEGEPVAELPGRILEHVWELVTGNPEQLQLDIAALHPHPAAPDLPAGVHHWGEHPVVLGERVRLEPGCAIDTTEGPVWLDDDVRVLAFTRLEGPAYVGPASELLGGPVKRSSIGPVCRVHGEVAGSICLGYSNKQHPGHLGHAYLGRWVNLGAGTNNSDLKNNYSAIRLWTPHGEEDTGEVKMGCLLGDHVKTGIGLQINTGSVIGACSNLYGAEMPPKHVPPFSWGSGSELTEYRLDKFLETAERAMERRDVPLSEGERAQLSSACERCRHPGGT